MKIKYKIKENLELGAHNMVKGLKFALKTPFTTEQREMLGILNFFFY